ncbi:MAG: class I SAM-dependent methyltransferase [Selenomonadaceae bacterium]
MGFSQEWEDTYKNNQHMSIWPWSDLVSYIYRYTNIRDVDKKLKVLELGCGAGANIKLFEFFNADYYAIDGSSSVVEMLRKRYPQYEKNILVGDFTKEIPFEEKFDLIFDRAALTHNTTVDIRKAITIMNVHLQKDGQFIGIDWFSTNHEDYSLGESILNDRYTRYMGNVLGQFAHLGNVHFSDATHLQGLFSEYDFQIMEEKIVQTVYPQDHKFASWNFVVKNRGEETL